MTNQQIIGFEVKPVTEKTGFLGRKKAEDQMRQIQVPGGNIVRRKSTLQAAGSNWVRFKRRIERMAAEKEIPFTDYTMEY